MGGKSTLARSIASVALLAHCGLFAPCSSARVPEFDSIYLRMAGSDAPADDKSGFAMEMLDLQSLLHNATGRTLIFLDEIGRGTEAHAGTSIGAAVLECLAERGCVGVFSTHLHDLLDIAWGDKVSRLYMGTAAATDPLTGMAKLVPTHRVFFGDDSRQSLAFATALDHGVPLSIVQRAEQYYASLSAARPGGDSRVPIQRPARPAAVAGHDDGLAPTAATATHADLRASLLDAVQQLAAPSQGLGGSGGGGAGGSGVLLVGAHELPGPQYSQATIVYAMLSQQGFVRIGETDDVVARLTAHRANPGWADASAILLQVGGKSLARRAEERLQKELRRKGWALETEHDAAHRRFGAAGTPPT